MLTNEIYALLKSARGLTVSFLKSRSPESLTVAIGELRSILEKAADAASVVDFGDLPPESVTFSIAELREKAALVQGDVCSNRDELFVAKSIKPTEFSAYLAAELAKAAELPAAAALDAGYSMLKRIDKALGAFEEFGKQAAEADTFVFYKEDGKEAAEVKQAAADAVAKGEAAPAPGPWTPAPVAKADGTPAEVPPEADIDAEIAKARATVEKARSEVRVHGGWGLDLATPRFMHGTRPTVDFGPDPK